jgi:methyl-accepting chemotaxis protein
MFRWLKFGFRRPKFRISIKPLLIALFRPKIGTKLAIVSAFTILLVAAMIGGQYLTDRKVGEAAVSAQRNQALMTNVLKIKAAIRGIQLGMNEVRAAYTPEDIEKGKKEFSENQAALDKLVTTALRYVTISYDRARLQKISGLVDVFYAHTLTIESLKKDVYDLTKGTIDAEAAKRIGQLNEEISKVAMERTLPVAKEMNDLGDKIIEVALKRGEEESAAADAEVTLIQNASYGLGGIVVLLLIGATGFSILTIARPMRKLTAGMLELADGNFDVQLPGLGRRDEIGDVAGAVETFKIKSVEKAEREAAEKAEQDRLTAEERSDRERRTAAEKAEQERIAAAERDAAMNRVMNEFDAAVGGVLDAAMAGDFSQRVPLEGKQGVILNLAKALNTMCDNVGIVLDDLVSMMGALADGDLTRRITAEYQGTFSILKDSANTTAERLSSIVADIQMSAVDVANAAAEISTSTTDLSERTEQQAAGLEQTSASMEEISATVRKNADNANHANDLTAATREVADRGGAVVAQAVEAMSRIEDSSRKIADIIGVIDEIARQTNLLALNAAVEAARAGDAGRGFAVVASEVRSLAQRSSQAAKDIKDLITNSSVQVKSGVELVNRTGTSLEEILASIKNVAALVGDIAVASKEQATGLDQVSKALTQMDEVTQQNSALVEENAATAKTLQQQSAAMTDRVGFFRIEEGLGAAAPQPQVQAPVREAPKPVAAARNVPPAGKRGGIVGRMQSALATALKKDPDWEEF